jgi:hypothetical protein
MVNRTRTCVLAAIGLVVMLLASLLDRGKLTSEVRRDADVESEARTR